MLRSVDTKLDGRFSEKRVVPHVATHETHQRPSKNSVVTAKRLFQHYLPEADVFEQSVASPLNRLRCGAVVGQRELKGRTPPAIGADPQTTAMGLDDPATDGQSHTRSLRFRGEERRENVFKVLAGKSNPGVTHRNQ